MSSTIEIQQAINKRPRVVAKRKRCLSLPAGDLFCKECHPNIQAIEDIEENEQIFTESISSSSMPNNLSPDQQRKSSASISYGQLFRDKESFSECGQGKNSIPSFNSSLFFE